MCEPNVMAIHPMVLEIQRLETVKCQLGGAREKAGDHQNHKVSSSDHH